VDPAARRAFALSSTRPTPALSGAGGFIARVRSNGMLGEYVK